MAEPQSIKPGAKTTEFYVSLGTQLVAAASLLGLVTPDQADALNQIIIQLASVISLVVVNFSYSWMRTKAKAKEAEATTEQARAEAEKAKADRAKTVLEITKAKLAAAVPQGKPKAISGTD